MTNITIAWIAAEAVVLGQNAMGSAYARRAVQNGVSSVACREDSKGNALLSHLRVVTLTEEKQARTLSGVVAARASGGHSSRGPGA